jgi:hypothetical protein
MIGHINFDRNPAGKRSAGKPPATFDEAGTGDVAWLRYSGTRRRKSEQQRTQTSTYTGAPVLDPTYERPVASAGLLAQVFAYAPIFYRSESDFLRPLIGLRGAFGSDWQWEMAFVNSRDNETFTEDNLIVNTAAIQAAFNATDPSVALNPFVDRPFDSPAFDSTVFNAYIQHYSSSDDGLL